MINTLFLFFVYTGLGLLFALQFDLKRNNWQKLVGESFFIGIFIVIITLNIIQLFELNLNQIIFFYVIMSFSFIAIMTCLFKFRGVIYSTLNSIDYKKFNTLPFLIAIVVIIHLYFIIEQNKLLPLTPWDAWSAWVAKAKIWYYYGINQDIVNQTQWSLITGSMTNKAAHYPDGLPLLYLFNSGFYGWNETALNAIYPAMFVSLLLLFYGNVKLLTNQKYGLAAVLIFATLPLVNVHIVLAGYADIWIASFLIIVIFNTQYYLLERQIYHLLMLIFFLISMVMFKVESIVWMLIALTVFLLARISRPKRKWTVLSLFVILIVWYLVGGINIESPFGQFIITTERLKIPGFNTYTISFVDTTSVWVETLFFSRNWNFLWYFLPIVLICLLKIKERRMVVLPGVFLVLSCVFLYVLFSLTNASSFAKSFTSINRIILHIVPIYIYFITQVVYQYRLQRKIT